MIRFVLALTVFSGIAACAGEPVAPTPLAGTYVLSALRTATGEVVPIPASVPTGSPGDSTRFVGGTFVLGVADAWSVRQQTEFRSGGVPRETRTAEDAGRFSVTDRQQESLVLDLYPDRPVTADRPWTALVRGDTIEYGVGVFVRR
jgi:hypothetical protein